MKYDMTGEVSEDEMLKTFNCGLGMILIVGYQDAAKIIHQLPSIYNACTVGYTRPCVDGMS